MAPHSDEWVREQQRERKDALAKMLQANRTMLQVGDGQHQWWQLGWQIRQLYAQRRLASKRLPKRVELPIAMRDTPAELGS